MAPALTVKGFRTNQKASLATAVTDTQDTLATVDGELTSAGQAAQTASDALAALQQGEAAIRAHLATASMPADVDQLEQDLEVNLLAQSPASAVLVAAQDGLAMKTLERQRVSARLDRLRARLAEVEAALELATRDDDRATAWRAALTGPEVAAVVADAASAAVTALADAATASLKTWLGNPALFGLLQSRYDDALSMAADRTAAIRRAADALGAVLAQRSSVEAVLAAKADAYARQRELTASVVEQGAQRLAWVKTVLASAGGSSPVTGSEQARIDARAAAAVAGANAADKEKALHVALEAARAATGALEAKTLPKLALDPTYDPAADVSVQPERDAAATATAAAQTAKGDFDAASKALVDQWDVAVPPVLMGLATDVLRALTIVGQLKATVPGDLLSSLDTAEGDYAQAVQEQDTLQQLVDAAMAQVVRRMDDAAAVAPVAEIRLAAVVRGDE
jgi:hypothetical protein